MGKAGGSEKTGGKGAQGRCLDLSEPSVACVVWRLFPWAVPAGQTQLRGLVFLEGIRSQSAFVTVPDLLSWDKNWAFRSWGGRMETLSLDCSNYSSCGF